MWQRVSLIAAAIALGLFLAPAAGAQGLGIAQTCTTPTTGTKTAPNRPCWVAGIYSGDYTGTSDTDYYTQAGGHPFEAVTDFTVANTNGFPTRTSTTSASTFPPA